MFVKKLWELRQKILATSSPSYLFADNPMIYFESDEQICPECYNSLKVIKTETKTIVSLHIGKFTAHITFKICRCCTNKNVYVSREPQQLAPKYCNFGYDILVAVGKSVYQGYRTAKEVVEEHQRKNVFLSESEIYFLTKKFIIYLGLAHRESSSAIRKFMVAKGGYILHIDGTCDGGSPHLITVMDAISGFVLDTIKIPTENSTQIIPMLRRIKKGYGNPLALVSDMGKALILALTTVFPNTIHFICHYHFLRDIGKDLALNDYSIIRNRLKAYGISTKVQNRIRSFEKKIDSNPNIVEQLVTSLETDKLSDSLLSSPSMKVLCLTLLQWAYKAKTQGTGNGFPFDRQHLVFYQRLAIVYTNVEEIMESYPKDQHKNMKPIQQLMNDLEPLVNDKQCKDIEPKILEKITVFDKLRNAMRIAHPDGKKGLNDDGMDCDMKTIESETKKFYFWLTENYSNNQEYKKMIEQIEKYWEKLFAAPITVNTSCGKIVIHPQRTNNIMEQFFRRLKKIYLRKSGINSMAETLRTMLADVPLISNLENSDYMKILLNGKETLEERFAEIDDKSVRKEMNKNYKQNDCAQKKIQNIIKDVNFPSKLTRLFKLRVIA